MNYSAFFLFNREDAPYNNAVQFPTSRPFYLLIFTFLCQMIQGMNIQNESVESDDKTAITKHCLWEIPNGNEQREKPATVILVLFASGLEVTKTIRYLAKLEVSLFQI